ncbi:MAG: tryptophan 7-halogenase, partial [Chloroflexi bacterium]|nr:tryptophan 7-halogenase [Chloroflexota bacterium]
YGHGWHLDRVRFDRMLRGIAEQSGARVVRGVGLRQAERQSNGWALTCVGADAPQQVHAAFVVDATGRAASWARRLGTRKRARDSLVAIIGLYHANAAVADTHTLVEAVQDGWWYSANLPEGKLAVAYMTDADLKPHTCAQLPSFWADALARTTHTLARVKAGACDSQLRICAANSYVLERVWGAGWLAVGDAAAAYDPLSSLGISTALLSAQTAAASIAAWVCGDVAALHQYEQSVVQRFADFDRTRYTYYAREARWRSSKFWRRRQPALDACPPAKAC